MKRIAVVFPHTKYSTYDCAVGYTTAFRRLGYHVTEIHYELLWEHYEPKSEGVYKKATRHVVVEVVETCPDLVVVVDGSHIHNLFWNWMTRLGIKTAVVMTDCPYYDKINATLAEKADYAFANDSLSARKMGVPYLPLAYNPEVHHPYIVSDKYWSDVVFVGTGFPERVRFLEQVDWAGIDFKLFGFWPESSLDRFIDQEMDFLPNDETAQYYNGAKIVLNLDRVSVDIKGNHRIEKRESPGPRVYEAAACGALIASQSEIPFLGDNYLLCDTPEKLSEAIGEHLGDDRANDRYMMGKRARKAVESETYTHRAMQMLDTID